MLHSGAYLDNLELGGGWLGVGWGVVGGWLGVGWGLVGGCKRMNLPTKYVFDTHRYTI